MDDARFDDLARTLSGFGSTRRGLAGLLAGGALTGLLGRYAELIDAKKKGRRGKGTGKGGRGGKGNGNGNRNDQPPPPPPPPASGVDVW